MRRHIPRLAAILVLLAPVAASAFSIQLDYYGEKVVRWAKPDLTYHLDLGGIAEIKDGSDVAAFHASFKDWQDVACSSLTFTYLGATTNKDVLPIAWRTNGKNELVWITDSKWDFGQYVLGVTSPLTNYSGEITEADIAFNAYSQNWTTTGDISWNTQDVKSVAIHEIGHFFGLQHVLYGYSDRDPPTMAPSVDPYGRTASLHDDDKLGACFLYPLAGEYYRCASAAECPRIVGHDDEGNEQYEGQLSCSGGYCTGVSGLAPNTIPFGAICVLENDCILPNQCLTLDSGIRMCTRTCDPKADDCDEGFQCAEIQSAEGGWCIPGTKKKAIGETCATARECVTSFCHPAPDGSGMTCRQACQKNDGTCPEGETCWAFGTAAGGCYPVDEVPVTLKKLGWDCAADAECESGVCWSEGDAKPLCRKPCDPAAPDCFTGYYCAAIGDGRAACVPGEAQAADGEACQYDPQCLSGHCVARPDGAGGFCRTLCSLEDWACPWGTACVSYGSPVEGVCMPSVDRLGTGEACVADGQCTTYRCGVFASGWFCTQHCVDDWCPEGLVCVDHELGRVCAPPSPGTPDEPAGMQDAAVTDDTGAPPGPLPIRDDGCAATGGRSDPGALLLLGLVLAAWFRGARRRAA